MTRPFYQASGLTPVALEASAIVTGGTAITAFTGPCNGGFITNPPNSASQGIMTAENLYVDMVNVPGDTDAAGNGTTTILLPAQNFTFPSLAPGATIKVNAATAGHKFSGEAW
jgi:hypothetical protein